MEFIIDIRLRMHIVLFLWAVWGYFFYRKNRAPIGARGMIPIITIFLGAILGAFFNFPQWSFVMYIILILIQVAYYTKGRYDIKRGLIEPDNKITSGRPYVQRMLAFPAFFILVLFVEQLIILLRE